MDDPEQRLLQMVPGGNGVICTLYADGRLKWFKHLGRDTGTYNWADGNGREIGFGWQIHPHGARVAGRPDLRLLR
ncbi:hypothetical protein C8D88_112207 [Lentzea atacamensis]|uniref:Uncharacterized protein n=1 Tax=Lentzea atacamensis TaxID=531938 RepID=A0A316HRA6_9PSEU|nr:hypothetical protein [Lentzea atacamensis]PWK82956.1 hypothetical protein C8D88_112207 [Lentzea atacamensis]